MPRSNLLVSYQMKPPGDNCEPAMTERKATDFDINISLLEPPRFLIILGLIGWGLRDSSYRRPTFNAHEPCWKGPGLS